MLENEERLEKLRLQAASQPPPQAQFQQEHNPLAFVVPTEFVSLPSKGKYYPEGHPLHGKEVIEIKQMTTKEEDILTNKSLIKKGLVIDKLLESVIVDRSINTLSLLIGDRNAILLAARRTGYGDDYEITATCGNCSAKSAVKLSLTKFIEENEESLENKLSALDQNQCGQLPNGNIVVKLPKTEWLVECRLLSGKDELYLLQLGENKKKSSISEDVTIVEQMLLMIESIQLVNDKKLIADAIRNMPASDAKFLRRLYQEASPSFDMKTNIECKSCLNEHEVEVGFNQEFFWPKR